MGHELEEQIGGVGVERDVADLVDDEQLIAAQLAEFGLETVAGMRCLEAVSAPANFRPAMNEPPRYPLWRSTIPLNSGSRGDHQLR